jgi:hypothetical protein
VPVNFYYTILATVQWNFGINDFMGFPVWETFFEIDMIELNTAYNWVMMLIEKVTDLYAEWIKML